MKTSYIWLWRMSFRNSLALSERRWFSTNSRWSNLYPLSLHENGQIGQIQGNPQANFKETIYYAHLQSLKQDYAVRNLLEGKHEVAKIEEKKFSASRRDSIRPFW